MNVVLDGMFRLIFYLAWRIEETIRFTKQNFDLEDQRLLSYQRLRNMFALVTAALAFNMSHISLKEKLHVLHTHALSAAESLFAIPDFHYYTLAQGIAYIFKTAPKPTHKPPDQYNRQDMPLFN